MATEKTAALVNVFASKRYLLIQRDDLNKRFTADFVPSALYDTQLHDIITLLEWRFDPYAAFFPLEDQERMFQVIIELILDAANVGYNQMVIDSGFPGYLRRAYSQAVRALHTIQDGCYITPVFLQLLRDVYTRAWRDARALRKYSERSQTFIHQFQTMATFLAC